MARIRPNPAAAAAVRAQRRRSDRVLDHMALAPARRAFDQQQATLLQTLTRAEKGRLGNDADMQILRRFHRAITGHVHETTQRLSTEFAASSRETLESSFRGLAQFMGKVQGTAGPLDDDSTFRSLVAVRRAHVEELRRQAMHTFGRRLEEKLWIQARDMAASGKYTIREVVTAVAAEMDAQWWQVERLARTESSYAFNVAQAEGVRTLARHFPGMMQRWTELVDDATGQPLDSRVGKDSLALHGQVAPPGGSFTMPEAAGVHESLIGRSWTHPPNRPNDRAVLTPWMREWGLPAWRFQGGQRVNLR